MLQDFLPGQQQRKTGCLGCDHMPLSFLRQNHLARALCKGSCDEFPREFLVASACADLSEHLPLLHEVSMSLESFSALPLGKRFKEDAGRTMTDVPGGCNFIRYAAQKIEVTPSGAWMVAQEFGAQSLHDSLPPMHVD